MCCVRLLQCSDVEDAPDFRVDPAIANQAVSERCGKPCVGLVAHGLTRRCELSDARRCTIPFLRQTPATSAPSSTCLITNALCASVTFDAFLPTMETQAETLAQNVPVFRWQSNGTRSLSVEINLMLRRDSGSCERGALDTPKTLFRTGHAFNTR